METRNVSIPLATQIAASWRSGTPLDPATLGSLPADARAAFDVQHAVLAALDARIGGWKIGAKGADGPIQGAPLPHLALHPPGARLARPAHAPFGLELEIAFRLGRTFAPRDTRYADEEVLESIASMLATVEIVTSRYAGWPDVDRFAQLADLQNHGALVVGEAVPYDTAFPFVSPALQFRFDGEPATLRPAPGVAATNPAGDPRRLLPWLVNHGAVERGIAVTPELVLTTGSYIGMVFPTGPGTVEGRIDGLPPLRFEVI